MKGTLAKEPLMHTRNMFIYIQKKKSAIWILFQLPDASIKRGFHISAFLFSLLSSFILTSYLLFSPQLSKCYLIFPQFSLSFSLYLPSSLTAPPYALSTDSLPLSKQWAGLPL